jgi:hypothetical protein
MDKRAQMCGSKSVILSSLKYMNLRGAGDIYKPCKWTIPDIDIAEIGVGESHEAIDTRTSRKGYTFRKPIT